MSLYRIAGTTENHRTNIISTSVSNVSLQDIVTIINSSTSNNLRKNIFGSSDIITANGLIKIAAHSKYLKSNVTILNDIVEIINNSESLTKKYILGYRKITLAQLINIIKKNCGKFLTPANSYNSACNINISGYNSTKSDAINLPIYDKNGNIVVNCNSNNQQNNSFIDIDILKQTIEKTFGKLYNTYLYISNESAPNILTLQLKENCQNNIPDLAILQNIITEITKGAYSITTNVIDNLPIKANYGKHDIKQNHQDQDINLHVLHNKTELGKYIYNLKPLR